MANALTTEQVLLLNNLMYMNAGSPFQDLYSQEGKTLGEVLNAIDINAIDNSKEYGTFTTGKEWKDILNAVKNDERLSSVRVAAVHDDGRGGKSILFANPTDNEAIVLYKGTGSSTEWKDNFLGGSGTDCADGVSTAQQESALEWYQSLELDQYDTITVSGHSKGGNKAKYVTIMDSRVDRCLSFDGQGFSDEFYDKYGDKIARNQDKIHNHNVDGDYVNILLNDVGETTYYHGYNYGDGKFAENHCPNTFLNFKEDGSFTIDAAPQDESMKNMDEFLNSYLRSLSPKERQKTMELLGEIAQIGFGRSDDKTNDILDALLDGKNGKYAAELLAYVIVYEQKNPELADSIRDVLNQMGFHDVVEVVDVVADVMNSKYFDLLLDVLDGIGGIIPNWLLDWFSDYIKEKWGIDLDRDQLRQVLDLVHDTNEKIPGVRIGNDRADRRVESVVLGGSQFRVRLADLRTSVDELAGSSNEIRSAMDELEGIIREINGTLTIKKIPLWRCRRKLVNAAKCCDSMKKTLDDIVTVYEKTEQSLL